jgi:tetratricopeptide (TPR) repeat protein
MKFMEMLKEYKEFNEYKEGKELEGKDFKDLKEGDVENEEMKGGPFDFAQGENEDLRVEEPSVWEVFEQAIELQGVKRYREAKDMLREMLNDKDLEIPKHLRLQGLSMLARIEYWLGNYKAAEAAAQEVIKGKMECCQELAYEVLARVAIDQFDFQLAEQYERKLSPSSTTRSMIHCFIELRKGNIKGAEASLNALAQVIDTKDPEFQLYRAMLDVLKGHTGSVLAAARQIQEIEGLNPAFTLLLAEIFIEAGSAVEASTCLSEIEASMPDHPGLAAVKAQFFYRKERFTEAEQFARLALQLNPNHQKTRVLLSRLQLRSGDEASAERTAKQVLSDAPGFHEAQEVLGDAYFAQELFPEARQAYEDSFLWSSRDSLKGHFRQARIAMIDEDYERALRLLEDLKGHVSIDQQILLKDLETCYEALEDEESLEEMGQEFRLRLFFESKQGEVLELVVGSV